MPATRQGDQPPLTDSSSSRSPVSGFTGRIDPTSVAGGAPKPLDDTACRGNADGEALESWLLAQAPPNSALTPFFADDSVPCR